MLALTPAERRDLRARAHRLQPVVSVGQHGLSQSVLHEIDVNLRAHELIKVRVFNAGRDARAAVLARICAELEAAPVQHIGKLLVLWRPAPPEPPAAAQAGKPRGHRQRHAASAARGRERGRPAPRRGARAAALSAAKSTPKARRPREPAARTPGPPPVARGRRGRGVPPATGGRRRRGGGQAL